MDWQSIQPFFIWISENPAWSGLIIFLIALSESLFIIGLFVPGTVLMFGVGTLVGTGVLGMQETLLFAFAGAVAGDGLSFWIGRRYHQQFSNIWPMKNNPHYLDRGKTFLKKHGGKSIIFGRFIGPIRPIVPAVAGMMGMPSKYFFTLNILSAAAWAPFYLLPGVVFGASIGLASVIGMRLVGLLLVLLVCGFLLVWLTRKVVQHVILRVMSYRIFLISTAIIFVTASIIIATKIHSHIEPVDDVKTIVSNETWKANAISTLATQRLDLFGEKQQTLNLQWAGSIGEIKQSLLLAGWQPPILLDYRSILYWLKPDVEISELPHIPQTHRGRKEALTLVKYDKDTGAINVIQLWPSNVVIKESGLPLWVGSLTQLNVLYQFQWLPYVKSTPVALRKMVQFKQSFQGNEFYAYWIERKHVLLIGGDEFF